MSKKPQPAYDVIRAEDRIEIRRYAPATVASLNIQGLRDAALKDGFDVLFGYISGKNAQKRRIPMTAPITQQTEGGNWLIRFYMPPGATADNLPKPDNDVIALRDEGEKTYAQIRFRGNANDRALSNQREELQDWMMQHKIKARAAAICAFYNTPRMIPFLRRNEVMIEIDPATVSSLTHARLHRKTAGGF
jgi:hypothetical protein